MRLRLTSHARRKLSLLAGLGVTEQAVEETLAAPDEVLCDVAKVERRIAVRYDKSLVVVYEEAGDEVIVVTVIYVSGLKKLVSRRKRSGRWVECEGKENNTL